MSQTMSFHSTSPVPAGRLARQPMPAENRVPMLDWPSNLFRDEATVGELVGVDFLMQCEPTSLPAATHGTDGLAH